MKAYGCVSSVLLVCVSVPPEWLSGLSQTVQLMSFPSHPAFRALVVLSPVFLEIDYLRKPIFFGVFGLYQMPMNSKIMKEGGEESGKGIIKVLFCCCFKYEQKQEHCHVTSIFFSPLSLISFSYNEYSLEIDSSMGFV